MKQKALNYLRAALNNPQAEFKEDQWKCIDGILNRKKQLVIQATGWGKSMVYFLATKLLREQGNGPTIIVSPLLALIENQKEAAKRLNIIIKSITSNDSEEDIIETFELLKNNQLDILMLTPERFSKDDFVKNVLLPVSSSISLFVVDEAHCISDWGHDFRPDYRRIARILTYLPKNVAILGMTATANKRVMADIKNQLGEELEITRGSLVRKGLVLQNIIKPVISERLAWLAQYIPQLKGSGIVYCLTIRDIHLVTNWLNENNISAKPYYGSLSPEEKDQNQQLLLDNQIKVLVATTSLGMGYDKPDIGFVIHYQCPKSIIDYYQQVGRAGRGISNSYGILMNGEEDSSINDFFINQAFPSAEIVNDIIQALLTYDALSIYELLTKINYSKSKIDAAIKYLLAEANSPIYFYNKKYRATSYASTYSLDAEKIKNITLKRKIEQQQIREYLTNKDCLMKYLQSALDDENPQNCGICVNCNKNNQLNAEVDSYLVQKANDYLHGGSINIEPRKKWPIKYIFEHYHIQGNQIPPQLQLKPGKALSLWNDGGFGKLVRECKYEKNYFTDLLVEESVKLIKNDAKWPKDEPIEWVTCVPSLNHPELVPSFAQRVANKLNLPFIPCIRKIHNKMQQKTRKNGYLQVQNLDGVFEIDYRLLKSGACLLIDDMIDSKWTVTIIGYLLLQNSVKAVYPYALALNSQKEE